MKSPVCMRRPTSSNNQLTPTVTPSSFRRCSSMGHESGANNVLAKSTTTRNQGRVAAREYRFHAQGRNQQCSETEQNRRVSLPVIIGFPLSLQNRDEAQWSKLQNLGMTVADEAKFVAMRDYILKLANNASRCVPDNICAFDRDTHPKVVALLPACDWNPTTKRSSVRQGTSSSKSFPWSLRPSFSNRAPPTSRVPPAARATCWLDSVRPE